MSATFTKTQDAPTVGDYKKTTVDVERQSADFRLIDVSCSRKLIAWRDGRREYVTSRQLAKLQSTNSWSPDF